MFAGPRGLTRRGDEPATARSPPRLRALLATGAAVVFTVLAALAAVAAGHARGSDRHALVAITVLAGVLAVSAVADLAVLRCRFRAVARAQSSRAWEDS